MLLPMTWAWAKAQESSRAGVSPSLVRTRGGKPGGGGLEGCVLGLEDDEGEPGIEADIVRARLERCKEPRELGAVELDVDEHVGVWRRWRGGGEATDELGGVDADDVAGAAEGEGLVDGERAPLVVLNVELDADRGAMTPGGGVWTMAARPERTQEMNVYSPRRMSSGL